MYRSIDDATITLLNHAYTHLEKKNSFVRILFIDFSSAFNTIQPHLMALKLQIMQVCPKLILWIVNFLVERSQCVRFDGMISSEKSTFTGAPQGTVLSPILFTLYTNDCSGTSVTPIIKYSDDSAIEDLSNADIIYFEEVAKFCQWCKENYLDLNVKKTKELVIDFRKNAPPVSDLFIDGVKVERVHEYKYLGTILDDKLNFNANTDFIYRKCQPRMYCLRKLRSLNIKKDILRVFYRSFIESVLSYGFLCWFDGLSLKNKNILTRVVNLGSKIVGQKQEGLAKLYECRAMKKAAKVASDETHILFHHYKLLPSGRRYQSLKFKTNRTQNSFIPSSIRILNKL